MQRKPFLKSMPKHFPRTLHCVSGSCFVKLTFSILFDVDKQDYERLVSLSSQAAEQGRTETARAKPHRVNLVHWEAPWSCSRHVSRLSQKCGLFFPLCQPSLPFPPLPAPPFLTHHFGAYSYPHAVYQLLRFPKRTAPP